MQFLAHSELEYHRSGPYRVDLAKPWAGRRGSFMHGTTHACLIRDARLGDALAACGERDKLEIR